MLDTLKEGDVLIADRYYPGYFTVAALQKRGIDMVSISHFSRTVDFKECLQLGENDHIVEWHKPNRSEWISADDYAKLPDTVFVREFVRRAAGKSFPTEA